VPMSRRDLRLSRGSSPTRSTASICSPLSRQISMRVWVPRSSICRGCSRTSSANSGSHPCNSWKGTSTYGGDCFESSMTMSSSLASVRKVRHLAEESWAVIVMYFSPPGFVAPLWGPMNSAEGNSYPYCSIGENQLGQACEWGTGRFHCRVSLNHAEPIGNRRCVAFKRRGSMGVHGFLPPRQGRLRQT